MFYIIGSGPAGIASAVALINNGNKVTMLDAGFALEPERAKIVNSFSKLDKSNWDTKSVSVVKSNMSPNSSGLDIKYVYGSDYPYKGMNSIQPLKLKNCKMVRSLAKGGLSNVWGASMLPFLPNDIKDWPFGIKDLEPHYRSVLSFVPLAGYEDDLASHFPIYKNNISQYKKSNQIESFMLDLEKNKNILNEKGFIFGHSRLAVNFEPQNTNFGCNYCGLCLYGCPYGLIYSTSHTLEKLMEDPKFNYIDGILVEKLIENNGEVIIKALSINNSEKVEYKASRVLLGAGTISSTRIMMESLGAYNQPIVFKHSDIFQIPLIRYRKTENVMNEELHTLAQMYIHLIDPNISNNIVHMQLYSYNDLYSKVINKMLGPFKQVVNKNIESFLGRLLVIKGYLHSNHSSETIGFLEPGSDNFFMIEGHQNSSPKVTLNKIISKINSNNKLFKGRILPFLSKLSIPGSSNHSGGTFPMVTDPSGFQSDVYGRPYGFENVHIVDSTTFPSIPSTTILFSIMANSHRIASHF